MYSDGRHRPRRQALPVLRIVTSSRLGPLVERRLAVEYICRALVSARTDRAGRGVIQLAHLRT